MYSQDVVRALIDAIPRRHSVRNYLPETLMSEELEKLTTFIDGMEVPFAHAVRLVPFRADSSKKLYNNGVNPADNIAVFSQTDCVSLSKAGFVGELAVLYAVSFGLSTCWFGHYKLSELGRYFPGIATPERIRESTLGYGYGKGVDIGERVVCSIPVGRPAAELRLMDRFAKRMGAPRKPIAELMERKEDAAALTDELAAILTLASLAPSAANSQMWRFGVKENGGKITLAKPVGYKHFKWEHPDIDIGICAAHLWLGMLHNGMTPTVDVTQDADRALWTFTI